MSRTSILRRWLVVILAVVPFQLPLLQHLAIGPTATGFLHYDAPYYLANAREIFERGNGFAYPNAYDTDAHAPAIYFHWLIWVFGAGVKLAHVDPGVLFAVVGLLASLICSALTLRLVDWVLPDQRERLGWFLLTMWGGGVICLGTMGLNLATGRPWDADLFRLDAGEGLWFPNWGRNLVLSTEAVYHCLVAGAWIGVLQRRWALAIGGVAALAATHPFSGLQHLLILSAWVGCLAWHERTSAAWGRVAVVGAILVGFGAYYFWFLNQFPSHRQLVAIWAPIHQMSLANILLAVGPLVLVVAWRVLRPSRPLGESGWFLLTASCVSFLLMKHDWFITSHQPAHFSRGYLWLSLWLLALPQLSAWFVRFVGSRDRLKILLATAAVGGFGVVDNAAFIAAELNDGEVERIHLSEEQRELFAWMEHAGLDGVFLCSDLRVGYYSATYTSVRPYLGHLFNTPDIRLRWRNVTAWYQRSETGEWLNEIDYVLAERAKPPAGLQTGNWREIYRNATYVLYTRELERRERALR